MRSEHTDNNSNRWLILVGMLYLSLCIIYARWCVLYGLHHPFIDDFDCLIAPVFSCNNSIEDCIKNLTSFWNEHLPVVGRCILLLSYSLIGCLNFRLFEGISLSLLAVFVAIVIGDELNRRRSLPTSLSAMSFSLLFLSPLTFGGTLWTSAGLSWHPLYLFAVVALYLSADRVFLRFIFAFCGALSLAAGSLLFLILTSESLFKKKWFASFIFLLAFLFFIILFQGKHVHAYPPLSLSLPFKNIYRALILCGHIFGNGSPQITAFVGGITFLISLIIIVSGKEKDGLVPRLFLFNLLFASAIALSRSEFDAVKLLDVGRYTYLSAVHIGCFAFLVARTKRRALLTSACILTLCCSISTSAYIHVGRMIAGQTAQIREIDRKKIRSSVPPCCPYSSDQFSR